VVGTIPTGLPGVSWPHLKLGDLWVLLPSAAGMMLVIFSEALGARKTFADKHGYRLESSQEMIALGLPNLGSGVLGGLACGGSLSQPAVNDGAGARTELSPIIAAALSLVTVVALTPLVTDLPEAVLAALIIHAVSHLMKVGEMKRFRRLVPREFWLAMLTLLGVIVLDVLPALIIGVVIAMPSSRRWGVPGPWCSSWTATTTSTSPAPSSSASWPAAWPPGTSRSAWPTCTARPWRWPNGPGCSPWSVPITSSRPRPPLWPGHSR
jgi:Sulfate permease family